MQIRRVQPQEISQVYALLANNGWRHRLGDPARFEALLAASPLAEVAVREGELLGFVRALSDGQSNGYLSMLVVAPAQRCRGIGRRLVERVMGSDPGITWMLRAGREDAAAFFARLGFEPSTAAMERRRA